LSLDTDVNLILLPFCDQYDRYVFTFKYSVDLEIYSQSIIEGNVKYITNRAWFWAV
jgi:hypothetical protein